MEFCKHCMNILLPRKNHPNALFCRVCDKSFPIKGTKDKKKIEQYKKVTKTHPNIGEKKRALKTAIIETTEKVKSMTEDDREAYGELLEFSGE